MTSVLFTLWLAFFFSVGTASATVIENLQLHELFGRSTFAVTGTVTHVHTEMIQGRIVTSATIECHERWGEAETETGILTVRVPGGQVGELAQKAVGAPVPKQGERIFLILAKASQHDNHFVPVGLAAGYFRLTGLTDADTGTSDRTGLRVREKDGTHEAGRMERWALGQLRKHANERFGIPISLKQGEKP